MALDSKQLWACHDAALAVSTGILPERADAQDVAQEVLVKVWQRYHDFTGSDDELLRIARRMATNASVDVLRRISRDIGRHLELEVTDAGDELLVEYSVGTSLDSPEDILAAEQQKAAIMQAVNDLAPQQVAVYFMHANGASFSEIATRLGVSEDNSRQLLSRAIAKLRMVAENY
jgi:RNA polymerase sigma-70 factor (ECF subfamily)